MGNIKGYKTTGYLRDSFRYFSSPYFRYTRRIIYMHILKFELRMLKYRAYDITGFDAIIIISDTFMKYYDNEQFQQESLITIFSDFF